MYCIVEFTSEEGSFSLVPSTWITTDKSHCYWPPCNPAKLIQNNKQPGANWPLVEIRVKKEGIDSLEKGRKKERELEKNWNATTTDAETPVSTLRRRHNQGKKKTSTPTLQLVASPTEADISSEASSESEDILAGYKPITQDSEFQKAIGEVNSRNNPNQVRSHSPSIDAASGDNQPALVSIPRSTNSSTINQVTCESQRSQAIVSRNTADQLESGAASRQSRVQEILPTFAELFRRQEAFEKTIGKTLAEIKVGIDDLSRKLQRIVTTETIELEQPIPFDFPIENSESLNELTEWLADEAHVHHLVKFCSLLGGNNLGDVVRTILRKLIGTKLAKLINFSGQNQKISFESLKLTRVVIDATRANKGFEKETQVKIEKTIAAYFRNARDLDGGKTERNKKKSVK